MKRAFLLPALGISAVTLLACHVTAGARDAQGTAWGEEIPGTNSVHAQPTIYTYEEKDEICFTTADLNVRDQPSAEGNILETVLRGTQLHVTGRCMETGWSRIEGGYVSTDYLSQEAPDEAAGITVTGQTQWYSDGLIEETGWAEVLAAASSDRNLSGAFAARYEWYTSGSSQADIDSGSMVEWAPSYYAADIKYACGQQVASLRSGDYVRINGSLVQIDGEYHGNYNYDSLDGLIALFGERPMFQTCEPPYGGPIVVKYGHWA